jgi:N-acetylornithine carbamoyltransferase
MQTGLRGRDLISLSEWTTEEIDTVLEVAADLKLDRALGSRTRYLRDKVLAMLFFFSEHPHPRFVRGGHGPARRPRPVHRERPPRRSPTATRQGDRRDPRPLQRRDRHPQRRLGRRQRYIREVAEASRVPVLNMQCDWYHPFQALADLLTIIEHKGHGGHDLRDLTIDVSWAYAATYTKPMSVPQSLILLLTRYGANVRLTHPPEFRLMDEVMDQAHANAAAAGGSLELLDDMDAGFRDADVVYPKSWGCMLTTTDGDEGARIAKEYEDWIADERRMALAKDDAIYLHCLPAERGVEVTDGVIDGPHSRVYDEAENRLHVQKAVMALTM